MADNTSTALGNKQKAQGDGTTERKSTRDSLTKFGTWGSAAVLVVGFIVVSLIWSGGRGGNFPPPPLNAAVPREPTTIQARSFGEIIAPVGRYSVWLEFPRGACVDWWVTEDPRVRANNVKSRFMDRNGDVWAGINSAGVHVKARSWQSNLDRPVSITYQVRPRETGGCTSF